MTKPRVLVSILNWNGGDGILACLDSLSKSEFRSFAVVVIDNGSVDGSVDRIRQAFPWVSLIQNTENLGFCKGQNQGLRLATEQGFDCVWVLNDDTLIEAGALGELVAELDANPTIAMVSPVIVDGKENGGTQYCGTSIDWDTMSFRNWETLDLALEAQAAEPDRICLWGTALLVRVSALKEIGHLDELFFAYYEDYDLSLRAIRRGFQNRVVAKARIFHFGQNDSSQRPAYYVYFNTRNRALLWNKHLPLSKRPRFWREYIASSLMRASGFEEIGDTGKMNATLLAIWDAIRGQGGGFEQSRIVSPRLAFLCTAHPYLLADILRGKFSSIVRRIRKNRAAR